MCDSLKVMFVSKNLPSVREACIINTNNRNSTIFWTAREKHTCCLFDVQNATETQKYTYIFFFFSNCIFRYLLYYIIKVNYKLAESSIYSKKFIRTTTTQYNINLILDEIKKSKRYGPYLNIKIKAISR